MNENPIIRFIDEQAIDKIEKVKEATIDNEKSLADLKEVLINAQIRIAELMRLIK